MHVSLYFRHHKSQVYNNNNIDVIITSYTYNIMIVLTPSISLQAWSLLRSLSGLPAVKSTPVDDLNLTDGKQY